METNLMNADIFIERIQNLSVRYSQNEQKFKEIWTELRILVDQFPTLNTKERLKVLEAVPSTAKTVMLMRFSFHSLVAAVRGSSPDTLRRAVFATVLEGPISDWRNQDLIRTIVLIKDGAEKIGIDPIALIDEVAGFVAESTANSLEKCMREYREYSIESMGFEDGRTEEGFTYALKKPFWETNPTRGPLPKD